MCLWTHTEDDRHPSNTDFDGGDSVDRKRPVWDQKPDDIAYVGNTKKSALHCTIAFENKSSAPLLRRHLECPSTSPYGEGGSPCVSSPTNMSAPCKKCGGIDGNHCVGCEN